MNSRILDRYISVLLFGDDYLERKKVAKKLKMLYQEGVPLDMETRVMVAVINHDLDEDSYKIMFDGLDLREVINHLRVIIFFESNDFARSNAMDILRIVDGLGSRDIIEHILRNDESDFMRSMAAGQLVTLAEKDPQILRIVADAYWREEDPETRFGIGERLYLTDLEIYAEAYKEEDIGPFLKVMVEKSKSPLILDDDLPEEMGADFWEAVEKRGPPEGLDPKKELEALARSNKKGGVVEHRAKLLALLATK